jgi:hypothetical protein
MLSKESWTPAGGEPGGADCCSITEAPGGNVEIGAPIVVWQQVVWGS